MFPRVLLLFALIVVCAGYFGPWVWHPAVVFRYSADDLAAWFVRLMPAVRSGQVLITPELFFLPIWLASIGLALWLGSFARRRAVRLLAGGVVIYATIWPMPTYPAILDAYRSPEFALSFWGSAVVAAIGLAALTVGGRLPDRPRALAWLAIGVAGATITPLHFVRLKPALDAQHGWSMGVGWGIGAVVIGFTVVAAIGAWESRPLRNTN